MSDAAVAAARGRHASNKMEQLNFVTNYSYMKDTRSHRFLVLAPPYFQYILNLSPRRRYARNDRQQLRAGPITLRIFLQYYTIEYGVNLFDLYNEYNKYNGIMYAQKEEITYY